jgi:beta-mannosidase
MRTCDLGGTWQARWFDGWRGTPPQTAEGNDSDPVRWIDAQVPGEIHLDLLRSGAIADPYVGLGCQQARWVEELLWVFKRKFVAPAGAVSARAWLHFERLELVARIVLNGVEVGKHANSHYPCRLDVTGKLKEGDNTLVVHIESGLWDAGDKPALPYVGIIDGKLHKRHWLRAPQCQFGWDWAPRLLNVGLTAPVRLEWTVASARIERVVPLITMSDDLSSATVRARVFIEGLTSGDVQAQLTGEIADAANTTAIVVKPGLHPYEVTMRVDKPRLWWPVGHGEQPRYDLSIRVAANDGSPLQASCRIGFRRARIVQDADPAGGSTFIIEINNRKIFAKGGNFVPADIIRSTIDRARYETLVDRALEANFNLLRVWGGGLYESEDFYDLCDERGILVWQEFIFACARYPGQDETFWHSVKAEALWNIRRLASHPSLVIWCGNNEIEWCYWDSGLDRGAVLPDHAIYHHLLPRLMADEDPTRYYQASSPLSPQGIHPQRDDVGDQHPWGTIMQDADFYAFRSHTSRFANEGGMLGPAALPTVLECMPEGQRKMESLAWQVHDNAVIGWFEPRGPDPAFQSWLGKSPRELSLDDWVYYAGLLQGEALREYCDNFRRRMFSSAAAIFWMYNDCWPTVRSWTIVDYRLRRTPAFHPVRRAMAPVSVALAIENDRVAIFGINDGAEPVQAALRFGLFTISGSYPSDQQCAVTLAANASTELASIPLSAWNEQKSQIAFAELRAQDRLLARNRMMTPRFAEMNWSPASPVVQVAGGEAVFTSDTFAWGICIDLDGDEALPDNIFDLYPGIPYRLPWTKREAPRIMKIGNLSAPAAMQAK